MTKRSSIVAASKQAERVIGDIFGGRRLHAGEWEGRPGDVDVLAGRYIIQVKHRKGVAGFILEGLKQIQESAVAYAERGETKIPLMIIKTKPGQGHTSRHLIVMEAEDWMKNIEPAMEFLEAYKSNYEEEDDRSGN